MPFCYPNAFALSTAIEDILSLVLGDSFHSALRIRVLANYYFKKIFCDSSQEALHTAES